MLRSGDSGDWIGTFEGHNGAVWGADLNSPALLAVTGSADFSAKIWDACSGDLMHSFEHKHIVRSVSFARESHSRFATGCQDKTIRIFDVNAPDVDPMEIPGLPASVRCLRWIQEDNLLLATCVDKNGIVGFDTRTGQAAVHYQTSDPCTSIDVAGDGSLVVAEASQVVVLDASRMHELKKFEPTDYKVESASISVEKGLIAMGGSDMWVHVVDMTTREEVDVCKGHHGPVHAVRFRPGGESFASGSEDGTIRLWSV